MPAVGRLWPSDHDDDGDDGDGGGGGRDVDPSSFLGTPTDIFTMLEFLILKYSVGAI